MFNWKSESVSRSVMSHCFATPWTVAHHFCPPNSLGKNTGVGYHFLLQRIFPTQGLNLGLLHCRQILYHLSHQGSPYDQLEIVRWSTFKPIFDLLCSCMYSEDSILESKGCFGLTCVSSCGLGGLSATSHHYSWWGYRPLPSWDGLTGASAVLWPWALLLETTFRSWMKIFCWEIFHIWVYFPATGDADSDVFGLETWWGSNRQGFLHSFLHRAALKAFWYHWELGLGTSCFPQDN